MIILNLEQFRELPEGTVFMKYEPCQFHGLCIKYETWSSDFIYQDLTAEIDSSGSEDLINKLDDAANNGTSLKIDLDCGSRDGLYDKDQLFAVYEQQDIDNLIDKLKECKGL